MTDTEGQAREALKAQGFKAPGPKLIQHVMDAIARDEEGMPAGERHHGFDPAELRTDTPELGDLAGAPGATEMSYAIADVLTKALRYVNDDPADS